MLLDHFENMQPYLIKLKFEPGTVSHTASSEVTLFSGGQTRGPSETPCQNTFMTELQKMWSPRG